MTAGGAIVPCAPACLSGRARCRRAQPLSSRSRTARRCARQRCASRRGRRGQATRARAQRARAPRRMTAPRRRRPPAQAIAERACSRLATPGAKSERVVLRPGACPAAGRGSWTCSWSPAWFARPVPRDRQRGPTRCSHGCTFRPSARAMGARHARPGRPRSSSARSGPRHPISGCGARATSPTRVDMSRGAAARGRRRRHALSTVSPRP